MIDKNKQIIINGDYEIPMHPFIGLENPHKKEINNTIKDKISLILGLKRDNNTKNFINSKARLDIINRDHYKYVKDKAIYLRALEYGIPERHVLEMIWTEDYLRNPDYLSEIDKSIYLNMLDSGASPLGVYDEIRLDKIKNGQNHI